MKVASREPVPGFPAEAPKQLPCWRGWCGEQAGSEVLFNAVLRWSLSWFVCWQGPWKHEADLGRVLPPLLSPTYPTKRS